MQTNNELYHHGIKGQKWYVRRFQPYPKGEKPQGAKEIGEAKTVRQRIDEVKSKNLSSKEQFKWDYREGNDMVLKKGEYLFRADENKYIDPKKKAIYAALKDNHLSYLNVSGSDDDFEIDVTVDNGNNGNPYSLKLKLQEDLVLPSYRKAVDTFVNTIKDLPVGEGTTYDENWGGSYNRDSKELESYEKIQGKGKHFIKKELKKNNVKSIDQLKSAAYLSFVRDLYMDGDRRKAFFNTLEKEGYNAIVDETDFHAHGDPYNSAVLVFKKDAIKQVGSKPVLSSDKRYIYERTAYNTNHSEAIKKYPEQHKKWGDWMSDTPKKKR